MDDALAKVDEMLRYDHGLPVELDERTFRLVKPLTGDPGLSVLKVLGLAHAASPVGAAGHGRNGVAVGVWRAPELYMARWTNGKRWVVGYRVTGSTTVSDYVSMEGRVPTRFETGHWYNQVPDELTEAFFEVGLLLDDPPFPVPAAAPTPPPRRAATRPQRESTTRPPAQTPRSAPARARPAAAKADRAPATRLCPSCRMHKVVAQFVPGSDRCVDCR